MRRIYIFLLFSLLSSMVSITKAELHIYDYGPLYNNVTENIVTPHIKWAKPYYRGKIKALIIAPRWYQRATVELAQRMEMDYATVMTFKVDQLAVGPKDAYESVKGNFENEIIADLKKKLEQKYDVIIIYDFHWKLLPTEIQFSILKKVGDGTGLVYLNPYPGMTEILKKVLSKETAIEDFIPPVLPFSPVFSQSWEKIVHLSGLKNGRIVSLDISGAGGLYLPLKRTYYEYYQSLIIKSVLWASKREPDIYIEGFILPNSLKRINLPSSASVSLISKRDKANNLEGLLIIRDEDNLIEEEITKKLVISPGKNQIPFNLPVLKSGLHFIDFFIKENGKIIDWGSSYLKVSSDEKIEKIVLTKEWFETEDKVKGKVILSGIDDKNKGRLKVKLMDNFDRIIAERVFSLEESEYGNIVEFEFDLVHPLTIILKVKTELYDNQGIIQEAEKGFSVPDRNWDDFAFVIWWHPYDRYYISHLINRQLADLGWDTLYTGWGSPEMAKIVAEENFKAIMARINPLANKLRFEGRPKDLVREPCLTEPQFLEDAKKYLRNWTEEFRKYGPLGYSICHEASLSLSPVDLCFSKSCQVDFRNYLKDVYGNLENLNKEWETNYQDWEEITPITLEEAQKTRRYAQWADHRLHMENVWLNFNKSCAEAIKEIDPEARVGFDGADVTTWSGWNLWRIANSFELLGSYGISEPMRSFAKKGSLLGGWYGSYSEYRNNENYQRYFPWAFLFHNYNSAWYWNAYGGSQTALSPDLSLYPYLFPTIEEIREIKSGIGTLILHSQRLHDKIAIHYSQSSVHAATIYEKTAEGRELLDSWKNWELLLEDLGFQYNYLSYEQIEDGTLVKEGYKVLILPCSLAISKKEAKEIEKFVKEGGLLIADIRPAVMDEHCKLLEKGQLDELLGISEESTGKALIINEKGKGKTLYLNFPLSKYEEGEAIKKREQKKFEEPDPLKATSAMSEEIGYKTLRKYGKGEIIRNIIRNFLASNGIESRLKLKMEGGEPPLTEVIFFKNGGGEYVGLLKGWEIEDQKPKSVEITFPKKSHLYDVRAKKYYGFTDRINTSISPGQAKLYALLPYQIKDIKLETNKNIYKKGEEINYQIEILTSSGKVEPSVVRLELYSPDGNFYRPYAKNILIKEGKYKGTVPLALNEKEGEWKISVSEIVSGKKTEKKIKIVGKEE